MFSIHKEEAVGVIRHDRKHVFNRGMLDATVICGFNIFNPICWVFQDFLGSGPGSSDCKGNNQLCSHGIWM